MTALLPLWAVILVVTFLVNLVNERMLNPLLRMISPYLSWADPQVVRGSIKVALFFVLILLITLLGMLVKNFFFRRVLGFGESLLIRIPLINKVYVGMQQISKTFITNKQAMFKKSVLIEYPRKGSYVLGFTTSDADEEVNGKTKADLICVFVPTTPNPTSGFLLFVPKRDVIELDMNIEDSFKLIVSFGGVTPSSAQASLIANSKK